MDENPNFTLAEICDKNCHDGSLPFERKTTCSFIHTFGFIAHAVAQLSLCVPHSNSTQTRADSNSTQTRAEHVLYFGVCADDDFSKK